MEGCTDEQYSLYLCTVVHRLMDGLLNPSIEIYFNRLMLSVTINDFAEQSRMGMNH